MLCLTMFVPVISFLDYSVLDTYSFDIASETFDQLPDIPTGHTRGFCGTAVHPADGPEFIISGNFNSIDVYNINSSTWSTYGYLSNNPLGAAYVPYGDTFLYLGGSVASDLGIYQYDPETRTFFQRPESVSNNGGIDPLAILIDGSVLNCV